MTITVIGHGYVGLVSACVFAQLGHTVYVIGHTPEKLERLRQGEPIIYEPGLADVLKDGLANGRLIFTTEYAVAVPASQVVIIGVGTPPTTTGAADTTAVMGVAEQIGSHLGSHYTVVCCKSTVPLGTNRAVQKIIEGVRPTGAEFEMASCPEFLREGSALTDTLQPDRVVIGSDSQRAIDLLTQLHEGIAGERVVVGLESAELIKYAANSLLAVKISFANLIADMSERSGVNAQEVLKGVGLDRRIGGQFLQVGIGYGGSCFPKDVAALISIGTQLGADMSLLSETSVINTRAQERFAHTISTHAPGKKLAVWGLSFKANTDDVRFSPAIAVIQLLLKRGFSITASDPKALENARTVLGSAIQYEADPLKAAEGADAIVIATEWPEYAKIDLSKVRAVLSHPVIFDGRNLLSPESVRQAGFAYHGVARGKGEA